MANDAAAAAAPFIPFSARRMANLPPKKPSCETQDTESKTAASKTHFRCDTGARVHDKRDTHRERGRELMENSQVKYLDSNTRKKERGAVSGVSPVESLDKRFKRFCVALCPLLALAVPPLVPLPLETGAALKSSVIIAGCLQVCAVTAVSRTEEVFFPTPLSVRERYAVQH